ncbi:PREDICTED: LOW QUALITY PROTEIN: uncharacterized protein LOC105588643, partial [Cercocebus atys]|uniref:LOW QUALITY PROTEIN: uncharacterized protein LOC105588643 n=1 Tax=Cercocebus atys TaxID=9531 RepID=UPI0005F4EF4E
SISKKKKKPHKKTTVWRGTSPIHPYVTQDWLSTSPATTSSPMTHHLPPVTAGSPVTPQAAQMLSRSCWPEKPGRTLREETHKGCDEELCSEPEPTGDTPVSVSGERDR